MPTSRHENWGKITEDGLRVILERKDVPRRKRGSISRRAEPPDQATTSPAPDDRGDYMRISREMAGRYSRAIADLNPLYRNQKAAGRSIWGRLLVPPGVLAWTEQVNGATDGFPGCHTIWRGCELEWERPIFVGERVYSTTYLRDTANRREWFRRWSRSNSGLRDDRGRRRGPHDWLVPHIVAPLRARWGERGEEVHRIGASSVD